MVSAREEVIIQVLGDILGGEGGQGAEHFPHEHVGLHHLICEDAEGGQADHAELLIPHEHRLLGAPFLVGKQPGADEEDLRLKGGIEAVFPGLQLGEHRHILGGKGVMARAEHVGKGTLVEENRALPLPDDQLGAHFDFMARHGELKHDHVLLEIRRFNDLYKLVFDEIK